MPAMHEIYQRHSAQYDRLVAAEDHARHLPAFLHEIVDWDDRIVLEGGLGSGRLTEFYIQPVRRVYGFDRESHMLAAARVRLAGAADKLVLRPADNRDLPDLPVKANLFIEGWSWGHSIMDSPEPVAAVTEDLFQNIRKNLTAESEVILIETLGTNCREPNPPMPRLAEFYEILHNRYGLRRSVLSTDYRFPTVRAAADILGFFFGESMHRDILAAGAAVIPEWTGVWTGDTPA